MDFYHVSALYLQSLVAIARHEPSVVGLQIHTIERLLPSGILDVAYSIQEEDHHRFGRRRVWKSLKLKPTVMVIPSLN